MTRRCFSGGLALVCVAAVSGCGAETPERCVDRFVRLLAENHLANDPRDARFQPIFTYDVTRMENVLEQLVGDDPEERAGMRMTIAHGASGAALAAFYKADVPPKGAAFAADNFSLFRIRGTPGSRDETIAEGCREARPDARLIHIQWVALPSGAEESDPI